MSLANTILFILMFIPILTFHEAAHAWAAHMLGDDTARYQGRLTLNPIAHVDLLGTIIVPAIGFLLGGFGLIGWGKPVPIDSTQFRNWRRDDSLVALAGPLANILLALIVLFAARWIPVNNSLRDLATTFSFVSVFLALFNLIPIPPLDGWHPVKHLFRIPEEFEQRGGWWWLILMLVLINLHPVQLALYNGTILIVSLLQKAVFF
jgi:Zn-dependent protease